jgi:polar amino acid transport system substrate-binding protein
LKICTEDTQWIPFIFSNAKGRPTGIILDIVDKALKNVSIKYSLNVLPWKRYLQYVKDGEMDAALAASYNDKRALYMNYPLGAKQAATKGEKAEYRNIQADYVVVNLKTQKFEYTGDIKKKPTPIYVPSGYSIAYDLKKMGLEVDSQAKQDVTNFLKLEKRKIGSIIVIRPLAERYVQEYAKSSIYNISKKSFKSKSAFFTFSKKTKIKKTLQKKIWRSIKEIREKEGKRITSKY